MGIKKVWLLKERRGPVSSYALTEDLDLVNRFVGTHKRRHGSLVWTRSFEDDGTDWLGLIHVYLQIQGFKVPKDHWSRTYCSEIVIKLFRTRIWQMRKELLICLTSKWPAKNIVFQEHQYRTLLGLVTQNPKSLPDYVPGLLDIQGLAFPDWYKTEILGQKAPEKPKGVLRRFWEWIKNK